VLHVTWQVSGGESGHKLVTGGEWGVFLDTDIVSQHCSSVGHGQW
jgi:hypothetical protein